ncbi:MAG: peptidoglycan-binding protein [Clostridia bacterium]|nr:peptidoglycan-binding protein [Clostridia bacterium]
MEQQEKTSGKVLFETLREQFKKIVPKKPLRVLLAAVTVVLLLGLVIGIVSGSLAIARCGTGRRSEAGAEPVANVQPARPDPGFSNDTVVVNHPTEPDPTEIPLPTAAPTVEAQDTPVPEVTQDPAEATNYLGGRMLKKGDTDELILTVQSSLMELGYMDPDEPTDYFGNQTQDAIITFQKHNNLLPDGIVGEVTYALLVGGQAREYVMQEGDEGDDVKEVQDRLYELAYLDKNSRSGTFGEKTAAAVRSFQSANGLKVDGKVGAKTLNTLYSSDVVSNSYKAGDSDDNIISYQKRLQKLGYLASDYACTGKMDNKTVSAIKTFQEANGLVRDGCLGPATMEQINSKDAVHYAMRLGMSGSSIRAAQQKLYKLGYIRSSQITGYYGETTVEAVKTFQKRNGITQSGEINAKTLEKLESGNAKAAATATVKKTATPKPSSGGKTSTPKPSGSGGSGSSTTSSSKGVEKFIQIAESKIGCRYVRGAKGPNQFDCSGFVYWCLNQAGVRQGYMTSITWRSCSKYKRINSMSSLERGDVLVFVGSSMATGHVGIYLGDGKMIDASSSDGHVRITSSNILKSKYWQEHFLMAYRIWD